jgi:hypothetical protein
MIEWMQEPEIACYSPSLDDDAGPRNPDDI